MNTLLGSRVSRVTLFGSFPSATGLAGWLVGITLMASLQNHAAANETTISTLSLAEIPETATVEIRLPVEEGDEDLSLAVTLAAEFVILLSELGYTTVDRGGELIFRFAAEEPTYAWAIDNLHHASLPAERNEFYRHEFLVLAGTTSTANASISQTDSDTFRLRVSVARDRRPPLWTGFIERSVRGAERRDTYLNMANKVMSFWGRTYPK